MLRRARGSVMCRRTYPLAWGVAVGTIATPSPAATNPATVPGFNTFECDLRDEAGLAAELVA